MIRLEQGTRTNCELVENDCHRAGRDFVAVVLNLTLYG
jgi:hypothetical protein